MNYNQKQVLIFEVAEKLFSEYGFDGTSIRTIAKEAEINIAMISYYFGSKDKLLEQLINFKTADFTQELEAILKSSQDYFFKVEQIITLIIKRVHKNRKIYKIIHFEYSKNKQHIKFEAYLDNKKKNYELLDKFIKDGQQAGVFSKNVAIQLLLPTVLGTYFNFLYNQKSYEDIYQLDPKINIDDFIHGSLTSHIIRTIKAILTYED
jgi:AcrR family transcriptional regulator